MKLDLRALAAAALLGLVACSGNFSSGTAAPGSVVPPGAGGSPPAVPKGATGTASPSAAPQSSAKAGSASYALRNAASGFACPPLAGGYACLLRFNVVVSATPAPSPSSPATPSPSPAVSFDASASPGSSASPSPSPKPSGPTMALQATTLPGDAPKMVHVPAKTLDVVTLLDVSLTPSADFTLDGNAIAQFTLPKDQVGGRGFALQLFEKQTHHKKTSYHPVWNFNQSILDKQTLTFAFRPPKMTVGKNQTYLLVLYADDRPSATSSPSAGASPTASPSQPASPPPSASPSPVPS